MIRWRAAFVLTRVLAAVPVAASVPVLASAQEAFQLPSGNIHCAAFDGVLRCDVLQSTFRRPPRPRDCEQDFGDSVELGSRGPARMVCHGDTVADPKALVLGYGRAWQGRGLSCTASQAGLRCVNAEGRGFEMSRAALRLF
ncbi:DUF6636 domain-containing protein [Roseomonas sp. CAU 1739]|uniref:DUF6636 domain-containing protein n=1 Tax=Roseomonas sp. CAU 1739 TaxID=3140364 RepID=UPI00325A9BE9